MLINTFKIYSMLKPTLTLFFFIVNKEKLVVMGIKLALTEYALPIDPDEVACFDEFHERFGKYITAAQEA